MRTARTDSVKAFLEVVESSELEGQFHTDFVGDGGRFGLVVETQQATVGVHDDGYLPGPEVPLRNQQRPDDVTRDQASGVLDGVDLAGSGSEELQWIDAGVHAGHHRQPDDGRLPGRGPVPTRSRARRTMSPLLMAATLLLKPAGRTMPRPSSRKGCRLDFGRQPKNAADCSYSDCSCSRRSASRTRDLT